MELTLEELLGYCTKWVYAPSSWDKEKNDMVGFIEVTPQIASRLLTVNTANRNPKDRNIPTYASSMARGKWDCGTGTIGVQVRDDKSLKLNDGQNRCIACIKAGKTFRTLLYLSPNKTVQMNTDLHGKRTLADTLGIYGYKNVNKLAAIIATLNALDNGAPVHIVIGGGGTSKAIPVDELGGIICIPSNNDYMDYFQKNEQRALELLDKVMFYRRWFEEYSFTTAIFTALHETFMKADSTSTIDFFDRFFKGIGENETDPVVILRRTLVEAKHKSQNSKLPPKYVAAITIKAWNAYQDGRSIKQLRFTPGGSNPEAFPTAHGPIA